MAIGLNLTGVAVTKSYSKAMSESEEYTLQGADHIVSASFGAVKAGKKVYKSARDTSYNVKKISSLVEKNVRSPKIQTARRVGICLGD